MPRSQLTATPCKRLYGSLPITTEDFIPKAHTVATAAAAIIVAITVAAAINVAVIIVADAVITVATIAVAKTLSERSKTENGER